jgi:hypothetical protein
MYIPYYIIHQIRQVYPWRMQLGASLLLCCCETKEYLAVSRGPSKFWFCTPGHFFDFFRSLTAVTSKLADCCQIGTPASFLSGISECRHPSLSPGASHGEVLRSRGRQAHVFVSLRSPFCPSRRCTLCVCTRDRHKQERRGTRLSLDTTTYQAYTHTYIHTYRKTASSAATTRVSRIDTAAG